jgi:hypothetical protein
LNLRIKTNQGIYCECEHDKRKNINDDNKENSAISNNLSKNNNKIDNCFHCIKRLQAHIDRVILDDIDIYNSANDNCSLAINSPDLETPIQKPLESVNSITNHLDKNIIAPIMIKNYEQFSDNMKVLHKSPLVSISVVDTDNNLNVCLCAMMCNPDENPMNNLMEEEMEEDKICPICRNIIKQQPIEHRPTLISRKSMLTNDVIVSRIDSHFLSISNGGNRKLQDPYTPESCESHSPQPEALDEKEFPLINSTIDSPEIIENMEKIKNKKASVDLIHPETDKLPINNSNEPPNSEASQNNHYHNHIVSPSQLKTRLEILRRESQLCSDVNAGNVVKKTHFDNATGNKRKNDKKSKCCMIRDCVII